MSIMASVPNTANFFEAMLGTFRAGTQHAVVRLPNGPEGRGLCKMSCQWAGEENTWGAILKVGNVRQ